MHHEGEMRGIVVYGVLGFQVQSGNLCLIPWYWDLLLTQVMPRKAFSAGFEIKWQVTGWQTRLKFEWWYGSQKGFGTLGCTAGAGAGAAAGGGFLHCSGNTSKHKIWIL